MTGLGGKAGEEGFDASKVLSLYASSQRNGYSAIPDSDCFLYIYQQEEEVRESVMT